MKTFRFGSPFFKPLVGHFRRHHTTFTGFAATALLGAFLFDHVTLLLLQAGVFRTGGKNHLPCSSSRLPWRLWNRG